MHNEPHVGEPQRRTARAQVELMLSTDDYSGELLDRLKRAEIRGHTDTDRLWQNGDAE